MLKFKSHITWSGRIYSKPEEYVATDKVQATLKKLNDSALVRNLNKAKRKTT